MGMFDNIIVEKRLPLPKVKDRGDLADMKWKGHSFQTKDLANYLGLYKITKDGKLQEQKFVYEDKTEDEIAAEKEAVKNNKWCIVHSQRVVDKYWEDCNFTGYVNFYDSFHGNPIGAYDDFDKVDDDSWDYDYWVEWVAHIVEGKVKSIKLHKWEQEDNSTRKANSKKWKKELEDRHQFQQTFRFRYAYRPWNWCIRVLFRGVRSIGSAFSSSWKLEDKLKF